MAKLTKRHIKRKPNSDKASIIDAFSRTNYQDYFETEPNEIFSMVPAEEWAKLYVADYNRGFRKESFVFNLFRRFIIAFIKLSEGILGQSLYIKAGNQDFLKIEPRFRKILGQLKEDGVIEAVYRQKLRPDWPIIPCYRFSLNPIPKPTGGYINLDGFISGSDFNSNDALAAALAETIERYSLCSWGHKDKEIVRGSFEEMRNRDAVDPLLFKSFSQAQFKNPKFRERHYFDHKTQFDWIGARSMTAGKYHLVPMQLVYIAYGEDGREPAIRFTTTNGTGTGDSWERAAYSAACENIERDALMIFWLNKIVPSQIDPKTITDESIQKILNYYLHHNIEIKIFDITTDVNIPTFLVLSLDLTGGGPAVSVGCSADLDAEKAVLRALLECLIASLSVMPFMTEENFKRVNSIYPDFQKIWERGVWWSQTHTIKEIEWLLHGNLESMPPNSFRGENYSKKLETLKKNFAHQGYEAYFADATSPLAERYGLHVITSLIPGFYPLYLKENDKYLGVERLYNLPVKLGFLEKPKKEDKMNEVPHPML